VLIGLVIVFVVGSDLWSRRRAQRRVGETVSEKRPAQADGTT